MKQTNTEITHKDIDATNKAAAFYTKTFLKVYDPLALFFYNRNVWKCPSRRILDFYNEKVSACHLDVGVGTGYFLDKCHFPTSIPVIGLMDLNPNCLQVASHRLRRYHPTTYQANVLEPIQIDMPKFDSISLNYVLHCLPGTMESKGVVFSHLKLLLNNGGGVFGTTILGVGVQHGWWARTAIKHNNKIGLFTNVNDSLPGLESVLQAHFRSYSTHTVGSVAFFVGVV